MAFGRVRSGEFESETASSAELTAFIDQGSEFEGKVSFKDTVRIDGRFRGEIQSENTLVVGETGEIHASIQSRVVVVSGLIVGDVAASEKLVLYKSGRIEGSVETACLAMEEGAELNGRVSMGARAGSAEKGASPRLKAVPRRETPAAAAPNAEDLGSGAPRV